MKFKCVLGQKVGDSVIKLDNGALQFIMPDTLYCRNKRAYWQLMKCKGNWKITKALGVL